MARTKSKTNTRRRRGSGSPDNGERFDVYQAVTDQIVAALEKGTVPWRKPWKSSGDGLQQNLTSHRPYRGINQLLLALSEYDSPYWVTFKKASELAFNAWCKKHDLDPAEPESRESYFPKDEADGSTLAETAYGDKRGGVRKGEHSTLVTFWKRVMVKDEDSDDPRAKKPIFMLRYYRVFNVEQVDGIESFIPPPPPPPEPDQVLEECEEAIGGYVRSMDRESGGVSGFSADGPALKHGGDGAFYAVAKDVVTLPKLAAFRSQEAYYATAFHELIHSTGAKKRLDRPELHEAGTSFGTKPYAREELVAEIGAAMLCARLRIDTPELGDNTAAYIANWLSALADDRKLVVSAAARAQKAVDLVLDEQQTYDDDTSSESGR